MYTSLYRLSNFLVLDKFLKELLGSGPDFFSRNSFLSCQPKNFGDLVFLESKVIAIESNGIPSVAYLRLIRLSFLLRLLSRLTLH